MVSEQDIMTLEMYLDQALEPNELQTLHQRLSTEPELAHELTCLQQHRQARQLVWQSLEPSEDVGQRLADSLHQRTAHHSWFHSILAGNYHRIAITAACLAMFFIGWEYGRNAMLSPTIRNGVSPSQPVNLITQQQIPQPGSNVPLYEVRVTDSQGNSRIQQFRSFDEAQRFIEQVRQQLQQQQRQEP